MRIGESEVSKAYLGPTLLYSKSPLIASYKCYDKTNEDSGKVEKQEKSVNKHLSDCAEQIVKHGKKLMHCLSELESKSGEHYMERYGKRRRGGMRDSDYDDEDYPRYY